MWGPLVGTLICETIECSYVVVEEEVVVSLTRLGFQSAHCVLQCVQFKKAEDELIHTMSVCETYKLEINALKHEDEIGVSSNVLLR